MRSRILCLILMLLSLPAYAESPRYIDLSHDYSAATLHWPGAPAFQVTRIITGTKPSEATVRDFATNEHVGTHMDAPSHFAKGHPGIDQIPLNNLIGPAVKIDLREIVKTDRDYLIGIKDFKLWEEGNGKIPPGAIVLISTGYADYWPQLEAYAGIKSDSENPAGLHFPGLDPQAALWLIQQRKIKAIGIDTLSIDYGQSKTFESHQTLTQNNIPIFENVASMDELPAKNFTIYALPMKIKDGTGAPLRIIADIGA